MYKKLNTYPCGKLAISIIVALTVILLFVAMCGALVGDLDFLYCLIVAALFALLSWYFISRKYWNTIHFSEKNVWYKDEKYCWDNVYLTLNEAKPPILARGTYAHNIHFYLYFDNHFLTKNETNEAKRKGFYLLLTTKRAKQILCLYHKEIMILADSLFLEKKFPIIKEHNKKIKEKT